MPEDEVETIHILGEGGTVFEVALPLHEAIHERMAKGLIRRVNPDGSPHLGEPDELVPAPPPEAPKPAAAKSQWVAWAIVCGLAPDEAEVSTKQDLIDRYGTAG